MNSGLRMSEAGLRATPWMLVAIIAAAGTMRLMMASHSLWFDEQASVFFSGQSLSRLWSDWMLRETNPPLYYSLLKGWRAIAGSSNLAVRVPSIVASLAVIALVADVARRCYGRTAGLLAGTMLALSGQQLYFAEQARAYIFVECMTLLATGGLVRLMVHDASSAQRWRGAAIYCVGAIAAVYLHATMILFPAIATAAFIAADPRRWLHRPALLAQLFAADLLILAASGWEIRHTLLQLAHDGDNIAAIGLVDLRGVFRETRATIFLIGDRNQVSKLVAIIVLALIAGFVAVDRARPATRFLAALGILGIAMFALLGHFVPVFVPRTIIWIAPIPAILAAAALTRLPEVRLRLMATGLLLIALTFDLCRVIPALEQEDWDTPVAVAARYKDALMLVQGEAMGLLADQACRRRLRRAVCPYEVIAVIDPADHYDGWARGLFPGRAVPLAALAVIAPETTVFLFRKAYYHHLPLLLHAHGLGHGVPADGPAFLGPMPAAALRAS